MKKLTTAQNEQVSLLIDKVYRLNVSAEIKHTIFLELFTLFTYEQMACFYNTISLLKSFETTQRPALCSWPYFIFPQLLNYRNYTTLFSVTRSIIFNKSDRRGLIWLFKGSNETLSKFKSKLCDLYGWSRVIVYNEVFDEQSKKIYLATNPLHENNFNFDELIRTGKAHRVDPLYLENFVLIELLPDGSVSDETNPNDYKETFDHFSANDTNTMDDFLKHFQKVFNLNWLSATDFVRRILKHENSAHLELSKIAGTNHEALSLIEFFSEQSNLDKISNWMG